MKTLLSVTFVIALVMCGIVVAQTTQPPATQQESQPATKPPENKSPQAADEGTEAAVDEAVARTRRQVEMLDGIYKSGIVLITKNYVDGDEDLPAGTAFKQLFEVAKEKGWHEVRLVDATGDPYSDENVAVTEFEKRAIKALLAGDTFVEETVTENDKRYLLAATPIPVVMEKCTMCHSNYDMDKEGLVIGALTYRVPIDE